MKRSCFTLVELLVVIATIALLTAILLPSLQNSRRQARAALCGSNVKQLVFGLVMYETENETFPYAFDKPPLDPPRGGYAGNPLFDRQGWWWFNHITDYSRRDSDKVSYIRCPSRQINNSRLKNNVLCGNYGVNQSICKSFDDIKSRREEFVGTPLSSGDILHPGQTLLIVDSGYSLTCWWHVTDVPPVLLGSTIEDSAYVPGLEINKKKDFWPDLEWDAINGRHPSRTVNIGFADGHINRTNANDLFVEKIAEDYKNKNPLWSPK